MASSSLRYEAHKEGDFHFYLTGLYYGAFTPEAIRRHLTAPVGFNFAEAIASARPALRETARLSDFAYRFRSYVLAARETESART